MIINYKYPLSDYDPSCPISLPIRLPERDISSKPAGGYRRKTSSDKDLLRKLLCLHHHHLLVRVLPKIKSVQFNGSLGNLPTRAPAKPSRWKSTALPLKR